MYQRIPYEFPAHSEFPTRFVFILIILKSEFPLSENLKFIWISSLRKLLRFFSGFFSVLSGFFRFFSQKIINISSLYWFFRFFSGKDPKHRILILIWSDPWKKSKIMWISHPLWNRENFCKGWGNSDDILWLYFVTQGYLNDLLLKEIEICGNIIQKLYEPKAVWHLIRNWNR